MNTACPACGAEGAEPEDCGQSLSEEGEAPALSQKSLVATVTDLAPLAEDVAAQTIQAG
ncbi:MAG TPA: hypothetical protein H9835_05195 [Candidatus Agathobaculum merdigallinarum]|nr:hypothetical protein [Candidatus Agathobaculum merdigallinarum]